MFEGAGQDMAFGQRKAGVFIGMAGVDIGDDRQSATRQDTRHLLQRPIRVWQMRQDPRQEHHLEPLVGKGKLARVGMQQGALRRAVPRSFEHARAHVDPGDLGAEWRQLLHVPAGAAAVVEEARRRLSKPSPDLVDDERELSRPPERLPPPLVVERGRQVIRLLGADQLKGMFVPNFEKVARSAAEDTLRERVVISAAPNSAETSELLRRIDALNKRIEKMESKK